MPGPPLRTDIVEVFVFRRPAPRALEFLQMRRLREPMAGTWQPVMGHVEAGERAPAAARRELREETGFAAGMLRGFWQLEAVNTYYLASRDELVMSPGFAAEVAPGAAPVLDEAHDACRWIQREAVDRHFLWTGQRRQVAHLVSDLLETGSPVAPHLAC